MNSMERSKRAAELRAKTIDALAKLASAGAGATVTLGFITEGVPAENVADTLAALAEAIGGLPGDLRCLAIDLRELRDGGAS